MKSLTVTNEIIENRIFLIRGRKIMFDRDLARLYGVTTKVLNQSVSRNATRFPKDFMFQLTKDEMEIWKSQLVTSNYGDSLRSQFVTSNRGGRRYNAYAFTEQGVAMLSSVLNSEQAIRVNIQIMRTFTKIREMIVSNKSAPGKKLKQWNGNTTENSKSSSRQLGASLKRPDRTYENYRFPGTRRKNRCACHCPANPLF